MAKFIGRLRKGKLSTMIGLAKLPGLSGGDGGGAAVQGEGGAAGGLDAGGGDICGALG